MKKLMMLTVTFIYIMMVSAIDYPVTKSDVCMSQCLDQSKIFCMQNHWAQSNNNGVCCSRSDSACIQDSGNGMCSSSIFLKSMEPFACPHEDAICGTSGREIFLSESSKVTRVETKSGFQKGKTCSYNFKAPNDASIGDYIYFKVESAVQVVTTLSITSGLTSAKNVFCNLEAGDLIAARHPDSVFVSFNSYTGATQSSAKVLSFLSKDYLESQSVVNFEKCSDFGASLRTNSNMWEQTILGFLSITMLG